MVKTETYLRKDHIVAEVNSLTFSGDMKINIDMVYDFNNGRYSLDLFVGRNHQVLRKNILSANLSNMLLQSLRTCERLTGVETPLVGNMRYVDVLLTALHAMRAEINVVYPVPAHIRSRIDDRQYVNDLLTGIQDISKRRAYSAYVRLYHDTILLEESSVSGGKSF